jgi:hypothetical protein
MVSERRAEELSAALQNPADCPSIRVTGRFINAQRLTCKKKGRFDNRH